MSNCCVYEKPEKIVQYMHGNISFMFDCWADPVVHLLLLKSSMTFRFPAYHVITRPYRPNKGKV